MAPLVFRALLAFAVLLLPAWCIQSLVSSEALIGRDEKPSDLPDAMEDYCTFVKALGAWKGDEGSNVTVYMLGDSLLEQQAKAACNVATQRLKTHTRNLMTHALEADLTPGSFFSCEVPLPKQGTLTLAFYAEGKPPKNPDSLKKMQEKVGRDPDVLYFDAGLWYLHMLPNQHHWDIDAFVNFEEDMASFLKNPVVKKTPKVVYFKAHSICDEKYLKGYADIVEGLKSNPTETAQPCVDKIQEQAKDKTQVTKSATTQQCVDGFLVNDGISKLNARAVKAISASGAKVELVDGYDITKGQCSYTDFGDARHYPALVFKELKEMLSKDGATGSVDAEFTSLAKC